MPSADAMHTYLRNSPQAAARLVALMLTADGHASHSEECLLERVGAERRLGLAPGEFARIVQTLCEDQSIASTLDTHCRSDDATLTMLLAEVADPALRRQVLRLCIAVATADDYLADGEVAVLAAMLNQWHPRGAEA